MYQFRKSIARFSVLTFVLLIVGCAVESPQPPSRPAPLPAPTPSTPPTPSKPLSTPKIYSGSYPDRIEATLRDTLVGLPVQIIRNGDTVKLIVPGSTAFAVNSDQLQARFISVLDSIAQMSRDYGKTKITIKGYTDSTGSFEHNQQLSEHRAQAVGNYLVNRQVATARISITGYGPRYPIADNKTDNGRAQNRRVEIEWAPAP